MAKIRVGPGGVRFWAVVLPLGSAGTAGLWVAQYELAAGIAIAFVCFTLVYAVASTRVRMDNHYLAWTRYGIAHRIAYQRLAAVVPDATSRHWAVFEKGSTWCRRIDLEWFRHEDRMRLRAALSSLDRTCQDRPRIERLAGHWGAAAVAVYLGLVAAHIWLIRRDAFRWGHTLDLLQLAIYTPAGALWLLRSGARLTPEGLELPRRDPIAYDEIAGVAYQDPWAPVVSERGWMKQDLGFLANIAVACRDGTVVRISTLLARRGHPYLFAEELRRRATEAGGITARPATMRPHEKLVTRATSP